MRSSSGYSEILDPFTKSYKEFGSNNGMVVKIIAGWFLSCFDGYLKVLFDEAVSDFLGAKRNDFVFDLLCSNCLLSDLLKANKLEWF